MYPRSIRWPRAALATVVLGSTLLGGIAYADGLLHIPGVDRVIHGCYTSDAGKLRLIDPAAPGAGHDSTCKLSETAIQWNQQGPQGPVGLQGPAGINGTNGTPGAQGATGQIGPIGPIGPAGATGPSGAVGPQGPAGSASGTGYVIRSSSFSVRAATNHTAIVLDCPAGLVLFGGGVSFNDAIGSSEITPVLIGSGPVSSVSWRVDIQNLNASRDFNYGLFVMCGLG